jgi:TPR repeat protein
MTVIVFVVLLFLGVSGAFADPSPTPNQPSVSDYQTTDVWTLIAAIKKGDSKALSVVKARAEKGDRTAQIALGQLYGSPQEGMRNDKEAFKWWHMAAEQGDALAESSVGGMYMSGIGVTKDYKEALIWLRKAAEQGNGFAKVWIGSLYENGYGVKQDYEEAYFWYLLAEPLLGAWSCFDCPQGVKFTKAETVGKHLSWFRRFVVHFRVMMW